MLGSKNHSKQQLKVFVQLAKKGSAISDAQINEMILSKNIKQEKSYIKEIKGQMEKIDTDFSIHKESLGQFRKKLGLGLKK
jgi:hypothetical protein